LLAGEAGPRGSSGIEENSPSYNVLTAEEDHRIDSFKRVSPSITFIATTVRAASPRGFLLPGTEIPVGTGSGFLWDRQGHVVTKCHVITSPSGTVTKNVKVKLSGMVEACDARVVGIEPEKDLAVLKIDSSNLPTPMEVGASNDLQVGKLVLAIGDPFGLDLTLTTGVASATGREVQGFRGRKIKGRVQTDTAINP
jgi:S1-C subfamily serine protease